MASKKPKIRPRKPSKAAPVMNIDDFVNQGSEASTDVQKRPETSGIVTRAKGKTRRRMTIYFDPEVAEKLVEHCEEEGREISKYVNSLVKKGLGK